MEPSCAKTATLRICFKPKHEQVKAFVKQKSQENEIMEFKSHFTVIIGNMHITLKHLRSKQSEHLESRINDNLSL